MVVLLQQLWDFSGLCGLCKGVHPVNIRVVLADDLTSVLARVRRTLEKEFEIVAEVQNGEAAVAAVNRLDPDVLVIDISMPGLDGLRAAELLRDARCRTKIIFLTIHEDQDFVRAAFANGASGYVTKSHVVTDLLVATREVVRGGLYVSPSLQFTDR
jgi:DNA-binding NarL/FixJ family response regulator